MAEREEKIIKKGEKKEEKKPSLWQRMKKPLAAGLLGASLLFSPAKKADAIYLLARPPPPHAAAEVENDKRLKLGWKILVDYSKGKGNEERLQIAKKIFERVYEETKNPVALDLGHATMHFIAVEKESYQESKEVLLIKLESINQRLKSYPDDGWVIVDKQLTLMALFHAAHGLYFNKEEYREYRKEKEIDLYYEDAIKYGKELIEFEKELLIDRTKLELREYTLKGSQKISDSEINKVLEFIKNDLQKNEKMYKELLKEKRND